MENITNKRQLLIGKKIGWLDNEKFLHLYTIVKFTTDGKKYYREYPDGSGGEYMPTEFLLKNLEIGKLKCPELTPALIYAICKGRKKTNMEKQFDRQLSYYENYGTVRQGK